MAYKLPWQAYALTPWDRIRLYGTGPEKGGLGFRKGAGNERADLEIHRERPAEWGKVTRVAKRFVAGEYGAATYFEVAQSEQIDSGSLKNTIWKLQNADKPAKRSNAA